MSTFWKLQPQLRALCVQSNTFQILHSTQLCRQLTTASGEKSSSSFPFSDLSHHWSTRPPTPAQLTHASRFFAKAPPEFLWSAEKFKTINFGSSPEICFLGRSNVGKSSLLNALLGKKLAHTSSKPGRTKLMNAFGVGASENDGKNRLIVLDMPGYGKGGRAEWGKEIMKYLEKRKELRRAFLLIEAEHGIKDSDRQILELFKTHNISFQVVLAKADKILLPGSRFPSVKVLDARFLELKHNLEIVRNTVLDLELEDGEVGEVIACSTEKRVEGRTLGIDAVRFAMLQAAGLELKERVVVPKPIEVVPFEDLVYVDSKTSI